MRKRIIYLITIVLLSLLLISLITFRPSIYGYLSYNDSKPVLSSYGSHGQEVIEIQTRLSRWGYYSGSIDGVYGYKTYSAVRSFQAKNGLNTDGVAGPNTLAALGISSPSRSNASASRDVDLLAHLIYGEARGEPYTGQVAIGGVILNRTRDSRFPKTIAAVIYQPGAFDAVRDGQINLQPDAAAYKAARDALNGWDPSGGAVYYWNPATATSRWIWSRRIITRIGNHVFGI